MSPFLCLSLLSALAASAPLLDVNDSALVGSEAKEHIRPFEDLHVAAAEHHKDEYGGTAGKEFDVEDDEKGYYKSKSNKGNKGYKHFDSYHKKGGDKYGHEYHSSTEGKKGDEDGGSHYTSGSYHSDDGKGKENGALKDHKSAATDDDYSYSHYEADADNDGEHYESEADDGHYEAEGDHGDYSAGYEGEADSGAYNAEEVDADGDHDRQDDGETVEHNEGPYHYEDKAGYQSGYQTGPGGATSYYIRHY